MPQTTPLRGTVLALLLLVWTPAWAEVDHGVIADPIAQSDLDAYAEWLTLSDAQRQAADRMHGAYLDEHRAFRNGPLTTFVDTHSEFGNSTTDISDDVEVAKEAVRDLRRLHLALRAMDGAFFDRLSAVLADEQLERLPRVRAARERARMLSGPAQRTFHVALDADFSGVWREIAPDVTAETRELVDAMVEPYERALSRASRTMHEFALEYQVKLATRLVAKRAEAGSGPGSEADEGGADFALKADVLRQAQTDMIDKAAAVGDLHRRLHESVAPVLDQALREIWRSRFLAAYYSMVPSSRGPAADEIERILAHDAASPKLHDAVTSERAEYVDAADRIVTRMLDAIDAHRRSNASHSIKMSFGEDDPYVYADPAEHDREMIRLKGRLDRLNRETIERLAALVDEHAPGRITVRRPATPAFEDPGALRGLHSSISTSDDGTVYSYKHIPYTMLLDQFGPGRAVVAPISSRDVSRWADRLEADEDATILMDVLHDDYRDRFDALADAGAIAAMRDARDGLFVHGEGGSPRVPDENAVQRLFAAERTAVAAVRALDAWFFEELSVALGADLPEEARRRMERDRSRTVFLSAAPPPAYALFVFGAAREGRSRSGTEHAEVDVAALVDALELPPDVRDEVAPLLAEYDQSATALFERSFDAIRRFNEQRALLLARHLRFDEEDGFVADGMRAPPEMDETGGVLRDVLAELLARNRQLRSALEGALASPHREQFTTAYRRAAWPQVFHGAMALHDGLDAALGLEDLDAAPRAALADLRASYAAEFEVLSISMIEAGDDWNALRRFLFERDELTERVRAAARTLLGPEHEDRIAALRRGEDTAGPP